MHSDKVPLLVWRTSDVKSCDVAKMILTVTLFIPITGISNKHTCGQLGNRTDAACRRVRTNLQSAFRGFYE